MSNGRTLSLIALGLGLGLGACGSDDANDNVSTGGKGASTSAATVDVATAQLALDELTSNVDVAVTGFTTVSPARPSTGTAPPTTTTTPAPAIGVRCNAGGEASVGGYVNVVPNPLLVDVKVAIDYNACVTPKGTTIAGNVDFSQTVATGIGVPLRVETLYAGDITMTGRVNVTCPVDLNVLVDEAGQAVKVAGQFCGQDAAALKLQVMPRWQGN